MEPIYSAVLLRYGEIGIKSKQTRRRMTNILVRHLKTALKQKGISFSNVRNEYGRIFIETEEAMKAAEATAQVFGIVSTSPVYVLTSNLDDIISTGFDIASRDFSKELTFAVRARRVGEHEYTSQSIREGLGERIFEELNIPVDLNNPDQPITVEVRDDAAYIFTESIKGVGGMPTGTQGKVVCTVSTGLDSPIAAYKVMKRGAIPVFVYFDNAPYTGEGCTELAIRQATVLANFIYDFDVKLYIVPHGPDLDEARCHADERKICVMCKRNMLRLAREVAIRENADAIVTGEIIGEQASQTTANLKAISGVVTDFPVLRPLAGDDKVDIERFAQKIGTYKFAQEGLSCCTLAPQYPALNAKHEELAEIDANMDLDIIKQEVDNARVIILKSKKG
ncbi:MAG: tRNA 4-thiouridine(8) synthase ThiI [Candidatus Thorarchaeota archaeon]|nr:tRNA 4-thiouridine(8) synthase ThiI [Candidatus Thorarchaeota archaeon]